MTKKEMAVYLAAMRFHRLWNRHNYLDNDFVKEQIYRLYKACAAAQPKKKAGK